MTHVAVSSRHNGPLGTSRPADVVISRDGSRIYASGTDGAVRVYHGDTGELLATWAAGTKLGAIDLSPDGSFLLVLEAEPVSSFYAPSGWPDNQFTVAVRKIDTSTGAVTTFLHTATGYEWAFNDVAIFADGTALLTQKTLPGWSTWVQPELLNTQTGTFTTITTTIRHNSIISDTASGLSALVAEYDSSDAALRVYTQGSGLTSVHQNYADNVSGFNNGAQAMSGEAGLIAQFVAGNGLHIYNASLQYQRDLTDAHPGLIDNIAALAFDPSGAFLFVLDAETDTLVQISTSTWAIVNTLAIGQNIANTFGNFGSRLIVGPNMRYFTVVTDTGLLQVDNPAVSPTIRGTAGNDTLTGTGLHDILDGGEGADAMTGGAGDDVFIVDNSGDTVSESAGGGYDEVRVSLATYVLSPEVEKLTGLRATGQTLTGNGLANTITGGDGNDILDGGAGDDLLDGGAGDDRLTDSAGATATMYGRGGNDTLTVASTSAQIIIGGLLDGGAGDDVFNIGSGAQLTALGGDGADQFIVTSRRGQTLTGGAGRDLYTFTGGFWSVITDFATGTDGDQLDVRPFLLTNSSWISSGDPFAGGFLALTKNATGTTLWWDQDGGADSLLPFLYLPGTDPLAFGNSNFAAMAPVRVVLASPNSDLQAGSFANDLFAGGNTDLIQGGRGLDAVVYTGAFSSYRFAPAGAGWYAVGPGEGGRTSADRLESVERLRFADRELELNPAPLKAEFAAAQSYGAGAVAATADGGFILTWRGPHPVDGVSTTLFQFHDAAGTPLGTPQVAFERHTQPLAEIGVLNDGGFVVIGAAYDGAGDGLIGRVFNADGSPRGASFAVNSVTAGNQGGGKVAVLTDGSFIVTWLSGTQPSAQHFSAAGEKLGGEFALQGSQGLTPLADGGFLISWTSDGHIHARTHDASGLPTGPAFAVSTATNTNYSGLAGAALPNGNVLISWAADGTGSARGIWARIVTPEGIAVTSAFKVNTSQIGSLPDIAVLADGGFVIAWESSFNERRTVAQRFDADAQRVGNEIEISNSEFQPYPKIAGLRDGGFVATWDAGSFSPFRSEMRAGVFGDPVWEDRATGETVVLGAGGLNSAIGDEAGQVLTGTGGDDLLRAVQGGNDLYLGGTGSDALAIDWSGSTEAISFGGALVPYGPGGYSGAFVFNAGSRLDFFGIERFDLKGGAGDDLLHGGVGNDRLDGGAGADTLKGGAGDDSYTVDQSDDLVVEKAGEGTDEVRTALGSKSDFAQLYIIPANVENLTGTSATGQGVQGNALNNVIAMGRGADLVVLDLGGDDRVSGGGGNDYFYWGAAFNNADRADGGAGTDTLGLLGTYQIAFDADDLSGIEKLALYSSGNPAAPNGYNLTMHDANLAGGQTMTVIAQSLSAIEVLTFNGAAELDGKFNIRGGKGADTITGGAGNDVIWGNLGGDMLRGGKGLDLFDYNAVAESRPEAADTILDFARGDRINLGRIDADGNAANGDTAFTYLGTGAFTGAAGELRVSQHPQHSRTWVVEADVNGDKIADLTIYLVGPAGFLPQAGDFIL